MYKMLPTLNLYSIEYNNCNYSCSLYLYFKGIVKFINFNTNLYSIVDSFLRKLFCEEKYLEKPNFEIHLILDLMLLNYKIVV